MVIFDGPQGVGKDALIAELLKRYPDKFKYIVSYSTRDMRPDEVQGNPYFFISTTEFEGKLKTGDIFEYEKWHDTYRGMSHDLIKTATENAIAVKSVGIEGMRILKKLYSGKVLTIFITVNKELLRSRLETLGSPDVDMRMTDYERRISTMDEYDFIVDNDSTLEDLVNRVYEIIKGNLGL